MSELLERLRAAWDNLAPRERVLVSAAGGLVACALLWAIIWLPIQGASESSRERADQAQQRLELMGRLHRQYAEIEGRLSSVEQRIRSSGNDRGLRTVLDELAKTSGVTIDSMEERETPSSERYSETRMEVALKGVSLTQTINYLHNIEAEQRLLSVKSLRIKTNKGRKDDAELLDVTFTVSAFAPL